MHEAAYVGITRLRHGLPEMANMFHYFPAREDGAIGTDFPGPEAVQGALNSPLLHLAGLVRSMDSMKSLMDKALRVEESEKELHEDRKRNTMLYAPQMVAIQQYHRGVQQIGVQNQAANINYYNCGRLGHFSNNCPYPKKMTPLSYPQGMQQPPHGPPQG
ncbi:hypothetical protein E2562_030260 [Oryza meyeriana var. granulata]|uniref:CCHC-type domain-containing protein n=1 Tax=Oryza meyeriana var. granulata TaxID=110450 RepID=A0A6G1D884_9ORYZ|nr:hypothetical protein E2562_030260 [Oryza meyeriana var. granulata]